MACKQCLSCRIRRQSALCIRCRFEDLTAFSGEFWTLTYSDDHYPETHDLRNTSLFLKRLRKWNTQEGNTLPIRYLNVGEYGSKSGRWHHHLLIWNTLPQPDLPQANTPLASRLWPHGFVSIGTVTPASINYTARYTLKFASKGEEGRASWSLKPALGVPGMISFAQKLREQGTVVKEVPNTIRVEGRSYPLDEVMQTTFARAYWGDEYEIIKPGPAYAHLQYVTEKKFGDPIEAQRKASEEKNIWWETARVSKETH